MERKLGYVFVKTCKTMAQSQMRSVGCMSVYIYILMNANQNMSD